MKLATFRAAGETRWGAVVDDTVIDLNAAYARLLASHNKHVRPLATDALDFVRQGDAARATSGEVLRFIGHQKVDGITFASHSIQWLAPVLRPPKIIGIGFNYHAHRQELTEIKTPVVPVIFPKFPTSVIGSGEAITWNPTLTQKVDFETEMGVVIGKRAKEVPASQALNFVYGYCNLNDISARDLQYDEQGGKQFARGKSLDTFCPLGPFVVTKDEIPDPQNLEIRGWLNGTLMQEGKTGDMIFSIARLIEFLSSGITLEPGDIIATGTPPGVGHYRQPPIYLKPGDVFEVEVQGLGRLVNPVV